jgi:hypothetical protein
MLKIIVLQCVMSYMWMLNDSRVVGSLQIGVFFIILNISIFDIFNIFSLKILMFIHVCLHFY